MDRSTRLMVLALAALIAGTVLVPVTSAHHGWRWAENENSEITGTIKSVRLGNPHGEMTILVNGEEWTAEIGQPWRNEQAGLTPALLAEGTSVTVQGHRALDKSEKLIKAERVVIGGKSYNLYPDRD
jgi:hypothetical protein